MRGRKLTGAVWIALFACAIFGSAAHAAGGPANWMYEPTSFTEIHLTLPPASIAELEAEPKEYVEGTFELAETNGTPGSAGPFSAPLTVGIELKGNLGSLRSINEKAAFKIKFDKFVEGQRFLGLEKMTLNNMVQDPSMIHETVTYQAFHDMGVPAPHTGFTYLTVNGKSYGVHLAIETQDAQSLENAFGTTFQAPPQHLYAGEYGADVSNAHWQALEVSEGKKKEKGDLEAFVAAVEGAGGFSERVASVADLTEMTKDWLVEKFVGNWDGYAGIAPDAYHPNNYYLYSDLAGRFSMMPWGTDQTWQSGSHLDFGSGGGILFTDCLADPAGCRPLYLAAGQEALSALSAPSLDAVARCAAASLLPWQEYEAVTSERQKLPNPGRDGAENLEAAEAEVRQTREFIETRPAELAVFLGEPSPKPGATVVPCPALRPIGGFHTPPPAKEGVTVTPPPPSGSATAAPTASPQGSPQPPSGTAAPVPARLAFEGRRLGGRSVVLALDLPGPGRLIVTGTSGRDKRTACAGKSRVASAGEATATCRLTDRFAALLRGRWRALNLVVHFQPDAGSSEDLRQSIRLRRR